MKKLLGLFIFISMLCVACGEDNSTGLKAKQLAYMEEAKQMTTYIERFKSEFAAIKQLTSATADNEEVAVLVKQYEAISGSLESMERWYSQSAGTCAKLAMEQQAGTTTIGTIENKLKTLDEKAAMISKKAEMTVSELERMRGEIETVVQKVSKTTATPAEVTE